MSTTPRTVLFWGAGATASIGFPTTVRQGKILRELTPESESCRGLEVRVRDALGDQIEKKWIDAVCDLLKILGDRDSPKDNGISAKNILPQQVEAMRRNWEGVDDEDLRARIMELRSFYDWPALVAAINVCPGHARHSERGSHDASKDVSFKLMDLFNLLDMHIQSGHGFPDEKDEFLAPHRIHGARRALILIIQVLFYVIWHTRARTLHDLEHHRKFAEELGLRMQREGIRLAEGADDSSWSEEDEFILGDVSVVCLNWDPVGFMAKIAANRDLNRAPDVPYIGTPARKLQLNHDLGYYIPGPRTQHTSGNRIWQPMSIASAKHLNHLDHGSQVRMRVSRYLFPHGCLWWRECPNCGKLSSYKGDSWTVDSETLLPPPPLQAFAHGIAYESWLDKEDSEWGRGGVDARACAHCETLTYAHHTPVVMQTSFKTRPPPYLEEIQRDMRVVVQKANHIVLMGYSLPPDDVIYRAFLAARVNRKNNSRDSGDTVKCSVVDKQDGCENRWYYPDELGKMENHPDVVTSVWDLFGKDNVRYFGAGVPKVFLDGDSVTEQAVERMLTWKRL